MVERVKGAECCQAGSGVDMMRKDRCAQCKGSSGSRGRGDEARPGEHGNDVRVCGLELMLATHIGFC